MKTRPTIHHSNQGSVLLMTLFVVTVLSISIVSYLYLLSANNSWVARSQAWNAALALAEAGIEEGMAQVNSGFGTNNMGSANANGWSGPVNGIYGPKLITMPGGGTYNVTIDMSGYPPVITAIGTTNPPISTKPVSREVQVKMVDSAAFGGGIVALQNVTLGGNKINIDSFDSSIGFYNTVVNGVTNRHANGDVASMYGIVNVQSSVINGHLFTGPTGSYKVNSGVVGDLNYTADKANNGTIEDGWYKNDFNINMPDVLPPYSASSYGPPATLVTSSNTMWFLGSSRYVVIGDLVLNSGDEMDVLGNATLYVTGNVVMKSSGTKSSMINISTGSSLKIYVGGPSATFQMVNTAGDPSNPAGYAAQFQYYGLPNNTSLTWQGNSTYIGALYAPEALFTLGGGGANNYDYQGACAVNAVNINGNFNFHYDENLKRRGPVSGYVITSWRELPVN